MGTDLSCSPAFNTVLFSFFLFRSLNSRSMRTCVAYLLDAYLRGKPTQACPCVLCGPTPTRKTITRMRRSLAYHTYWHILDRVMARWSCHMAWRVGHGMAWRVGHATYSSSPVMPRCSCHTYSREYAIPTPGSSHAPLLMPYLLPRP